MNLKDFATYLTHPVVELDDPDEYGVTWHRAGCRDIARERAHGATVNETYPPGRSVEALGFALWADVASDSYTPGTPEHAHEVRELTLDEVHVKACVHFSASPTIPGDVRLATRAPGVTGPHFPETENHA